MLRRLAVLASLAPIMAAPAHVDQSADVSIFRDWMPSDMEYLEDLSPTNQIMEKRAATHGHSLLPGAEPQWKAKQNPDRFCLGWTLYDAHCYGIVGYPSDLKCQAFPSRAITQLKKKEGWDTGGFGGTTIPNGASGNIHNQICGGNYKMNIYSSYNCDDDFLIASVGNCPYYGETISEDCGHLNLNTLPNKAEVAAFKVIACPTSKYCVMDFEEPTREAIDSGSTTTIVPGCTAQISNGGHDVTFDGSSCDGPCGNAYFCEDPDGWNQKLLAGSMMQLKCGAF